jgi:hypothetical protein
MFLYTLINILFSRKSSTNFWPTSVIFKKLPPKKQSHNKQRYAQSGLPARGKKSHLHCLPPPTKLDVISLFGMDVGGRKEISRFENMKFATLHIIKNYDPRPHTTAKTF